MPEVLPQSTLSGLRDPLSGVYTEGMTGTAAKTKDTIAVGDAVGAHTVTKIQKHGAYTRAVTSNGATFVLAGEQTVEVAA